MYSWKSWSPCRNEETEVQKIKYHTPHDTHGK